MQRTTRVQKADQLNQTQQQRRRITTTKADAAEANA
jgi:hypothetical protein